MSIVETLGHDVVTRQDLMKGGMRALRRYAVAVVDSNGSQIMTRQVTLG